MNKKILIIVGIVLVLIVVGVWVYLLLTGKTVDNKGGFANFQTGSDTGDVVLPPDNSGGFDIVPPRAQRLRQLTTRPVAGAMLTDLGMLFVEQGTGHVYNLNLTTGAETLLSGTTLLGARVAAFSTDGEFVAITHEDGGVLKTIVGAVTADSVLDGVALPENAKEVLFDTEKPQVYYLLDYSSGSRGYVYDITTASAKELFDIPLQDIRVLWGDDMYAYTTPSAKQKGYLYKIKNNTLIYVTPGSYGLVAQDSPSGLVVTKNFEVGGLASPLSNEEFVFGALLPEKCASSAKRFVCAIPTVINKEEFPDAWYKGLVSYSDSLWEIDLVDGTSSLLLILSTESGQEIDVSQLDLFKSEKQMYFINKNDNTLWLFDENL